MSCTQYVFLFCFCLKKEIPCKTKYIESLPTITMAAYNSRDLSGNCNGNLEDWHPGIKNVFKSSYGDNLERSLRFLLSSPSAYYSNVPVLRFAYTD